MIVGILMGFDRDRTRDPLNAGQTCYHCTIEALLKFQVKVACIYVKFTIYVMLLNAVTESLVIFRLQRKLLLKWPDSGKH